jgi:hypothetical protein
MARQRKYSHRHRRGTRSRRRRGSHSGWSIRRFRIGTSTGLAYVEFTFPTEEGETSRLRVPHSELRHRSRLLDQLADHLPIFPKNVEPKDATRGQFIQDLVESYRGSIDVVPDRTGFIDKDTFATFREIIRSDGRRIPFERIDHSTGSKCLDLRGTFDGTHQDVLELANYSSYLTFAIGAALAACLPSYLRLYCGDDQLDGALSETAVFNFSGRSSSGKSSICRAAMSLTGAPTRVGTMNFSPRGLAELAADSNDLVLVLDDTESADHETGMLVRALKAIVHTVPGGRSKIISRGIDQAKFPQLRWSTIGLSSSPRPIPVLAAERNWQLSPGDKVRVFDIHVPSPENGGIFDRLAGSRRHRARRAMELIAQLERGYSNNQGQLIPNWIIHLIKKNRSQEIIETINEFIVAVGATNNGWEKRFARKFGLVYAALILGIKTGLLPLSESLALRAVRKCYRKARNAAMTESELVGDGANRLNRLISRGMADASQDGSRTIVPKECGAIRYWRNGRLTIGVFDAALQRIFPTAWAKRAFTKALAEAGVIPAGHGHAGTVQERLPIHHRDENIDRPRLWPIDIKRFCSFAKKRSRR